jgi:hypothetical protein
MVAGKDHPGASGSPGNRDCQRPRPLRQYGLQEIAVARLEDGQPANRLMLGPIGFASVIEVSRDRDPDELLDARSVRLAAR